MLTKACVSKLVSVLIQSMGPHHLDFEWEVGSEFTEIRYLLGNEKFRIQVGPDDSTVAEFDPGWIRRQEVVPIASPEMLAAEFGGWLGRLAGELRGDMFVRNKARIAHLLRPTEKAFDSYNLQEELTEEDLRRLRQRMSELQSYFTDLVGRASSSRHRASRETENLEEEIAAIDLTLNARPTWRTVRSAARKLAYFFLEREKITTLMGMDVTRILLSDIPLSALPPPVPSQ